MPRVPDKLVRWYYLLGTPAFLVVDLIWDAPIRASFIADARFRYAYYVGCVGFGLLIWKEPRLSRGLGMTESLVNFTMAILAIWVPIFGAYDVVVTGGPEPALGMSQTINAGVSGAFALASYYSRVDK